MDLNIDEDYCVEKLAVVLVGVKGCGKSSSGNCILGKNVFESGFSTLIAKEATALVSSYKVTVVDTPGYSKFADRDALSAQYKKAADLCNNAINAILIVCKASSWDHIEEQNMIVEVKSVFGLNVLDYSILVIVNDLGFEIVDDNEINDDRFKALVSQCKGRKCVLDNQATDLEKYCEIRKLLKMISTLPAAMLTVVADIPVVDGGQDLATEIPDALDAIDGAILSSSSQGASVDVDFPRSPNVVSTVAEVSKLAAAVHARDFPSGVNSTDVASVHDLVYDCGADSDHATEIPDAFDAIHSAILISSSQVSGGSKPAVADATACDFADNSDADSDHAATIVQDVSVDVRFPRGIPKHKKGLGFLLE